jgi:hypothetical protein
VIEPVRKILLQANRLALKETSRNWVAHIDGLAMGGKSAGVRKFIRSTDLVVVPTNKLKLEWIENLGKLAPVFRASVVTQHEALVTKYASRYVFIDEAYTFDLEHLQAIANRHTLSKGIVTIGDARQIANVFTQTELRLDPTLAPVLMVSPVTFAPWDVAAIYLEYNYSPIAVEQYYCGSTSATGLNYTVEGNEVAIPGTTDLVLQGTQAAKGIMVGRGIPDTLTSHESQGARSDNTLVHVVGQALQRDLRWLAAPEQVRHLGVTITRARCKTIFIADSLHDLRHLHWADLGVNGALPSDCLFGGTSWDLVEPRTIEDATIDYLRDPVIVETSTDEIPLTDPITIGTVFCGDEALAASEIRANVEVLPGVRWRDDNEPHSDAFDNYTLQPRDVPGADKQQALTRMGEECAPCDEDFINANEIVSLIFEEVLDRKTFFAHLANTKRAVLNKRTRQQAIDGAYAETEHKMSTASFGFLKPEFAKKESTLTDDGGELKAQGVVTASDMQQALFADVCDSLTHAWARSMRKGKYSPVGLHEQDIGRILETFDSTYELDITKQDSSHRPVHVLVAGKFLEMAADKLGMSQVAYELRSQRTVKMMNGPFQFILKWALASGDPWTLIITRLWLSVL